MKKNQGITLVALVITIIILLILAGITIAQLTGSGLFENARLAEEKSKNAQEKEEGILSDYENKIQQLGGSAREENYQYQKLRSDNYEEVPFVDGSKYVAPCDGYYCYVVGNHDATINYVSCIDHYTKDNLWISRFPGGAYYHFDSGAEVYMKKGEYLIFIKQSAITVYSSKFFYAVGCQPEETK